MRAVFILLIVLLWPAPFARAATPLLDVPDGQVGLPGSRVLPNVLLGLSLTYADAGAAYRGEYDAAIAYDGYFNHRMCYRYATAGYFMISKEAATDGQCGGDSFSGNMLNWASMTTLDLLRLGLTGGDRVVDERGQTVLQRAWLPDGTFHPDFHAHPLHFPRKSVKVAATVTPFDGGPVYIVSCRNRILFSRSASGTGCEDKGLGEFDVRVKVCDKDDSDSRQGLCTGNKGGFKPEGALQENRALMRTGVMGYLTDHGKDDINAYGGALRAPLAGNEEGAINYINLLGRSAVGRFGAYKSTDPGAELFYEGLRYLQGRPPTPAIPAVASDDGLAVWSTREDPLAAACQRNSIAMIGHSSFELDRYLPGNTQSSREDKPRPSENVASQFDVMQATRSVGDKEAIDRLDLLGDGPAGIGSFYLAGAASWAYTNAIRKDAEVRIETLALEIGAPSVTGRSALYLATKYGAAPGSYDSRGVPSGFFSGGDPHAIVPSVRSMLAQARMPGGEVAAQAAGTGSYFIQSGYDRSQSAGTLRRFDLAADVASPSWDAGKAMPAPEERKIHTLVYDDEGRASTVEFRFDKLPDAVKATFNGDGLGQARIDFLRGVRTREIGNPGGVFRRRASVIGDFIHSVPALVGAPSGAGQGASYAQFHSAAGKRRGAAYIGANDGMLHAFDIETGTELFAYVPNTLLPALPELTRPGYVHRAYVDASPGHGEALARGKWRTVLASGMGTGARGVFALDVTNPSAFASGLGALWEFTERDDPSIGHVRSPPSIAAFQVGTSEGRPVVRYFAVVSSGLNNYKVNGGANAARGALFLLSLDKLPSEPWEAGVNYYKLVTPVSDPALPNALSPPALALASNGTVRYAYAGDLQGNLWRFDFTGKPSAWTKAAGPGPKTTPLFVARDAAGQRQPITHAPRVVFAPGGGYIVLAGTGKFLEHTDADPASFGDQSFYGIRDSVQTPVVPIEGRSELARRVLAGQGPYAISGETLRFEGTGARKGWYFDFPGSLGKGERAAAPPLLASGAAVIDTLAPGTDACVPAVIRSYVVDAVSGLAYSGEGYAVSGQETGAVVHSGIGAAPLVMELGMSAAPRDPTGGAVSTRTVSFVRLGARGKLSSAMQVKLKTPTGRLSWREVANWQELHENATRKAKGKK
ncbi:pilus assembly protein [Massilia cavernae]|uniref:PilY1 beta-propeller domain-containing protein n=1 Tax=Massilia cavernae TaxID=2320864 RepID=A0A418XV93_9BURK|nr:PilC/PilY family type IV pilus protein [Massilia cavernae]RJG16626.1 hypothetical protein D3872_10960 [Massilia cavernae]